MCDKGAGRFWNEERVEMMMGGADCEAPGTSCPVVCGVCLCVFVSVVCECVCVCVCVCVREREREREKERENLHDKESLCVAWIVLQDS